MPIRVMSFNLWFGGEGGKLPLRRSLSVIEAASADIVGLQETHGQWLLRNNGRKLAQMLQWPYFRQRRRTGILSRFPIATSTPAKWGVILELPQGENLAVFNAHLAPYPYQPYQLLKLPYFFAPYLDTADEAIAAAWNARGNQVKSLEEDVKSAQSQGLPIILTGDFNEPSHHDWTAAAQQAGKCPLKVDWPTTRHLIAQTALSDAYRLLFPDEVSRRGDTWTTTSGPDNPKERHDRIDFIFVDAKRVAVKKFEIVGEEPQRSDVVVAPYPSDHRAVVATLELI